jgi:hypothetical protein
MSETIELKFASQLTMNDSPIVRHGDGDRRNFEDHYKAASLMRQIQEAAQRDGLKADRKSERETRYPGSREKMMGGGPFETYTEAVTIIVPSLVALTALIKAASSIIIEYLKTRRSAAIKYKDAEINLEAQGFQSVDEIVKAVKKLEKKKS